MSCQLQIQSQVSLKTFNSFNLEAKAKYYFALESKEQLPQLPALMADEPILILGGGSNLLFTDDFQGLVIHNRLMGKELKKSEEGYFLKVSAGENWHDLVKWSLEQGIGGLENLAAIPGTVGAAPVQNIGAYGCDFGQFCYSLETFNLDSGQFETLLGTDCQFGYRSSIFKRPQYQRHMIISVCLKLPLKWQAKLDYGPLQSLTQAGETPVTAQQVFDLVVQTREQKLPDPELLGNAGSFFKNPQISSVAASQLKQQYTNMPVYPAENPGQSKLAAGWLIDQCELKGLRLGGAQVHKEQALVLVNTGQASCQDVLDLAKLVQQRVFERFGVELEPEVRMMAASAETKLD